MKFEHGITDFTAADISKQMEENFYPKFETLLFKVCPGATKVHAIETRHTKAFQLVRNL